MKLDIQLFAYNTSTVTVNSQNSTNSSGYNFKIQLQYYFTVDETARTYTIYAKELFYHQVNIDSWANGSPYNRLLIDDVVKATTTNNTGALSGKGTIELCPSFKGSTWQNMGTFSYDTNGNGSTHKLGVSCGYASSWAGISRKTTNHNVTPPTIIPAVSVPTVSSSSVNLGSAVTIYTNRQSQNFTHKLTYNFGSASGTIAENVGDNYTWTVPTSLGSQIPTTSSGTCTITCETYNGGTLIGTKTVNLTLNVPSGTCSGIIGTLTEADTTMQSLGWGAFLQSKSRLNIPVSFSGYYGSYITNVRVESNGQAFSYSPGASETSHTFTTGFLSSSGTIKLVVSDSRGAAYTYTDNAAKTYTVKTYSIPNITLATAKRVNSSNQDDEVDGEYLNITFTANIDPIQISNENKNTNIFRIGYREKGASSFTYLAAFVNNDKATYSVPNTYTNYKVSGLTLDTSKQYEIAFEAIDTFYSSSNPIRAIKEIGTGFDLMNFNANGRAMAIGKVSEATGNTSLLEIGMNTNITGNLQVDGGLLGQYCYQVSGDWNTIPLRTGCFMGSGLSNAPSTVESDTVADWWYVIQIVHNNNYAKQIAFSFIGNNNVYYVRNRSGAGWGVWNKSHVKLDKTVTFSNYYVQIPNTDLGVSDCTYYDWNVQPTHWEVMLSVDVVQTGFIQLRCWRISSPSGSQVILLSSGDETVKICGQLRR